MKMQSSGRTEFQRNDSSDDLLWADCGSVFACRCLQYFWPRQLVRKWLQFKPTGDDFRADNHHVEYDSPMVEDEDDVTERTGNPGESSEFHRDLISPDANRSTSKLTRGQSETLRQHHADSKEYRIAVGTWNVAGRPPSGELELDDWLDSYQEADIYVLGFQEIVPLNAGNVLCIEDEGPAAKWENLLRKALNRKSTYSSVLARSQSAPQAPLRDLSVADVPEIEIDRIIDGVASEHTFDYVEDSEFSTLPKSASSKQVSIEDSNPRSKKPNILDDWSMKGAASGPAEGFHSFLEQDESLEIPLFTANAESTGSQPFSMDSSQNNRSRFSKVASKQMVGLFLTVWVRTELRRHVHDVKVSCVGCGLMGYLGNKGSISVSMSLHQTSFCFTCSHLTSGDKEGDEYRRNADVAEILRRTSFPRSSKLLQLPETIMSHDCMIWLGDLNYRLSLPDHEARSLVAQGDWVALLEKDQLKIEQNAGHVFDGWQEGTIYFAPTYKYTLNSDRYSGESGKSGEKRRTPAWCDRILYLGRGLRGIRYMRTESRFSDHRPVSAVFMAEVERFSRHKLKRAETFAAPIGSMHAEDTSPHLRSLRSFHKVPLNEMQYPSSEQRLASPVTNAKLTVSQSFKLNRVKEHLLPIGCMKLGDDMKKSPNQGLGRQHVLSVF